MKYLFLLYDIVCEFFLMKTTFEVKTLTDRDK